MSRRVSGHRQARPMRRALISAGIALAVVISPAVPARAAVTTELVPFRMDASNQAGWWHPIDEYNGRIYMAYNAWGSPTASGPRDTHQVWIAKRELDGGWLDRGCMADSTGACLVIQDDLGHHQPTIAVDGDGYIHAFFAMHGDNWRYYRSAAPGDVKSMANMSASMPDQGGNYTYPSATRTDNGDIYLIIRSGRDGRLYRWNNATNVWTNEATFARANGFVVYPDDVISAEGDIHIAWEWAAVDQVTGVGTNGLRHNGSYVRWSPVTRQFRNAAGAVVAHPVSFTTPGIVYQPIEGTEKATDRDDFPDDDREDFPGVQSAKLSFHPTGHRPYIAYRYRSAFQGPFRVKLAQWAPDGRWVRSVVYEGIYNTFAAVDITTFGTSGIRVYYTKNQTIADDHAFAATRQANGSWTETLLLSGVPFERLAVIRRGATDHLYLASPSTHQLYYGTNTW